MLQMRVLPLAVVLGALACTSAGVLRLDPMPRPRTNPDSIQLLGQEPQRPYIVIAIVSARTEIARGVIGTGDRVGRRRRLGGDAVLVDISSVNHAGGAITGKVIAFTQSTGVN
jgi:hypothetical protein